MLEQLRTFIDTTLIDISDWVRAAGGELENMLANEGVRWVSLALILIIVAFVAAGRHILKARRKLALHRLVSDQLARCTSTSDLTDLLFDLVFRSGATGAVGLYLLSPSHNRMMLRAKRDRNADAPSWESEVALEDLPGDWQFLRRTGSTRLWCVRVGDAGLLQISLSGPGAGRKGGGDAAFVSALAAPVVGQLRLRDELVAQEEERAGAMAAAASSRLLVNASIGTGRLAALLLNVMLRAMENVSGCVLLRSGSESDASLKAVAVQGIDTGLTRAIVRQARSMGADSLNATDIEAGLRARLAKAGFAAVLFTLLKDAGRVVGLMLLCGATGRFASHQQRMFRINAARLELSIRNQRHLDTTFHDYKFTLRAIASTLDASNESMVGHAQRISSLAARLADNLGLSAQDVEGIRIAGELHDVGMVGISDELTGRGGRISTSEYDLVKQHPGIGAVLTAPIEKPVAIAPMILHHHERFDGFGYPAKIAGEAIPVGARIIALAEVFDAMLMPRNYRPAMSFNAAVSRMQDLAGSQLDPALVAIFTESVNETWWSDMRSESLRQEGVVAET